MYAFICLFVNKGFSLSDTWGADLPKCYDFTIQSYYKSHTKLKKYIYFVVYGYKILDVISEAPFEITPTHPPPKQQNVHLTSS